jgi:hypothetical protein
MAKPQDDIIIEKLDQILANQQKFVDALKAYGSQNVSPELEAQVNRASQLAGAIDEKVPDQPSTQKKGQQNLWQ